MRLELVAVPFVIVAADQKVVVEQAVSLVRRATDALFHHRFRKRLDLAMTVPLSTVAAEQDP